MTLDNDISGVEISVILFISVNFFQAFGHGVK